MRAGVPLSCPHPITHMLAYPSTVPTPSTSLTHTPQPPLPLRQIAFNEYMVRAAVTKTEQRMRAHLRHPPAAPPSTGGSEDSAVSSQNITSSSPSPAGSSTPYSHGSGRSSASASSGATGRSRYGVAVGRGPPGGLF